MNQTNCERARDFVLVIEGVAELNENVENALYEAGCDDATLSMQHGRLYIEFSRVAPSLEQAILNAIRDVREANMGAKFL